MAPMPTSGGHRLAEKPHAHRILVVEDNGSMRDSLLMLLQTEGFEAAGVGNGREALRLLRGGYDVCLILLDLMMPVMDGWAFRVEQRHDERLADIPVVVLTATLNPAREATRVGAVAGLQKPLHIGPLLDLVAKYCPKSD
jgi:CheY-like chemotaxis protein